MLLQVEIFFAKFKFLAVKKAPQTGLILDLKWAVWNSETISICGGFGGFLWIATTFESPKSTSIEKFWMGVTAEVKNQKSKKLFVDVARSNGGVAITIVVPSRFRSRDFPPSFFK